jgi:hypothetical protein
MTRYICSDCGRVVETTAGEQGLLGSAIGNLALVGCSKQPCPLKQAMREDIGQMWMFVGPLVYLLISFIISAFMMIGVGLVPKNHYIVLIILMAINFFLIRFLRFFIPNMFSAFVAHGQSSSTVSTTQNSDALQNHKKEIYDDGATYIGQFKDGERSGQGTYTYANGQIDAGEFRNGVLNGQGTTKHVNGDSYVGEFRDDEPNGHGTYDFSNGDKYVGLFEDGQRHGQGTYRFANGDEYIGEYKDEKLNGAVTVSYSNGDRFNGMYRHDRRSGQGTYTWSDGHKFLGEWKDGLPTRNGVHLDSSGQAVVNVFYQSSAEYGENGNLESPDELKYSLL